MNQATHKELHEGVGGSGQTVYLAVTVRDCDGSWMHTERFDTKAEAECWVKFA